MLSITIPTACRKAIRRMVRVHPDYEAFRLANGAFKSRDITHAQTMLAIEALGLEQAVLSLVQMSLANPNVSDFADATDMSDEAAENMLDAVEAMAAIPSDATAEAEALINSVLDPMRQFLSNTLLGQLTTALTPIVHRAVTPITVDRVITQTVTLDADGNTVASVVPTAAKVGSTTIGKAYGISNRNRYANHAMGEWNATDAPSIDLFYVPDPATLAKFITRAERSRAVWLAGQSGGGKSTMPEQYAARAKRPFLAISFQKMVDPVELIGRSAFAGASKPEEWRDGYLTAAIRRPGTVILFDEITACPPSLLMILNRLMAQREITLTSGETVKCADGVVFVAADNTSGYGDETGLYAGTQTMNIALVDRFAIVLPVPYMTVDLEAQALANHTMALSPACRRVVQFVHSARKLNGFESWPLSLRRMVAFMEMLQDGFDAEESFELTFLTRLPTAEREALRTHFKAAFDASAMQADMSGKPQSANASSTSTAPTVDANSPFTVIVDDIL